MSARAFALLAALPAMSAGAAPLPEYPFVFAEGAAKTDIAPDMARLSFMVAERDKDAKVAAAAVDSTFHSVLTILAAAAIKDADTDASGVDKSPRSHWDAATGQSVPDGYEVARKIQLVARDLSKYPQLMKALLELPHTENFGATFDRSDRSRIEAEQLASAAQDAKARAERMAGQFGRKLGPVHAISQVPFAALPGQFGFGYGGPEALLGGAPMFKRSAESMLVPATITIAEHVNVVYELQPPQ